MSKAVGIDLGTTNSDPHQRAAAGGGDDEVVDAEVVDGGAH
ncbi:MAG: hypothetical protein AB1679_30095 [Actinomycetota bacterium]